MKKMLFLLLLVCAEMRAEFDLFSSPEFFSNEQREEKQKSLMNMSFGFDDKVHSLRQELSFYYKDNMTHFRLKCYNALPQDLSLETEKKFIQHKKIVNEKEANIFVYDYPADEIVDSAEPSETVCGKYLLCEPRKIIANEQRPTLCSYEQLMKYLQTKKTLFYTGAGVSAGIVPTLDQLISSLELSKIDKKAIGSFIEEVMNNVQKYVEVMDQFYKACFYGNPTPCHYALASLATRLQCKIITENLDFLHLRTHIDVPMVEANWVKENISSESLQLIDVVICVGLRSDERGFLAWYKKHNPKGIIVAINLEQPDYLGNEDFFLQGDAQEIIPEIANKEI